jgi:leucyl/phenylalanyl-tRNA--protein transferase
MSYLFPDPETARPDGLLAAGGDLEPETLLEAYARGIFPWYSEGSPILWWSPDPRMLFFPGDLHISHSLRQTLRSGRYTCTFDEAFEEVIEACAHIPRKEGEGTWITPEMKEAYIRLHELGYAHSVETWYEGEMVGGLYGVSLGHAFFGESMFHRMRDASKTALWHLVQWCREKEFRFIDAQMPTEHLARLGARTVTRKDFLKLLKESLQYPTLRGKWKCLPA